MKFDGADSRIFFGQGFYTFEKHLVIFTERGYGMLSKLVFNRYLRLPLTINSIKHINLKLLTFDPFLHSAKYKYGNTKST